MYATSAYQKTLARNLAQQLRRLQLSDAIVEVEWQTFARSSGIYAPRIDIGIGPFSTTPGQSQRERYIDLCEATMPFLISAVALHNTNIAKLRRVADGRAINTDRVLSVENLKYSNANARCFMAIEIENLVSRKHLLGGALNAAVLGHVGVVVAFNPNVLRALVRLLAYWDFLASVSKPIVPTANLIVLDRDQIMQALGGPSLCCTGGKK